VICFRDTPAKSSLLASIFSRKLEKDCKKLKKIGDKIEK